MQQLQTDKQNLVDNLVTKGVSATSDETFTSLVPKVLDIQSGGSDVEITDAGYLFYQNRRLDSVYEILDLCKDVTSCQSMFHNCSELSNIDLSNFDTSKVESMQNMFYDCSNLTNVNISNFDTRSVTTMGSMFERCSNLSKIDVSNFDTSNVSAVNSMFMYCSKLESVDLSSFDTSKVTSTQWMFRYCNNLSKLIINRQDIFKNLDTQMLQYTKIYYGSGYIYVPDNMVESYKSATNWSEYADQIKPISELPAEEA